MPLSKSGVASPLLPLLVRLGDPGEGCRMSRRRDAFRVFKAS